MAVNEREIALDALMEIDKQKAFSHVVVKGVLDKYDYLSHTEKAFIKRLIEGTVERQIELDAIINQFSKVPVNKCKPLIRSLLRMSVYQLLYMDSVPDHGVVNEACKLASKRKFQSLKPFVNGVLRTIAREKEHISYPDPEKNRVKYLSVKYSMPEWIVTLWALEYGFDLCEEMIKGLLEVSPVSIRFKQTLSPEERQAILNQFPDGTTQSPYMENVYRLKNGDDLTRIYGFEEGKWTIQDVSSVIALSLVDIKKDDFVLDACAAPGGKTMIAGELSNHVISRDVSAEKTERIRENLSRMELEHVTVEEWDASVTDESLLGKVDVLLLDVPCSGLGVMGKKRDIKYHVTPDSIKELETLQKQIVKACIPYLKEGGTLLYSTCTVHTKENEEMAQWIAEEFDLEPVDISDRIPKALQVKKGNTKVDSQVNACCLQILPGINEADGFFAAKFRKNRK